MHHQLNGDEFEQSQGDDKGQGSLACCSPWGLKESDMTQQLNTNNIYSNLRCSVLVRQLFINFGNKLYIHSILTFANCSLFQISYINLSYHTRLPLSSKISQSLNCGIFLFNPFVYLFKKYWLIRLLGYPKYFKKLFLISFKRFIDDTYSNYD